MCWQLTAVIPFSWIHRYVWLLVNELVKTFFAPAIDCNLVPQWHELQQSIIGVGWEGGEPEGEIVAEQGGEGVEAGQHDALPVVVVKLHRDGRGARRLGGQVQGKVVPGAWLQGAECGVGKRQWDQGAVTIPPPQPCSTPQEIRGQRSSLACGEEASHGDLPLPGKAHMSASASHGGERGRGGRQGIRGGVLQSVSLRHDRIASDSHPGKRHSGGWEAEFLMPYDIDPCKHVDHQHSPSPSSLSCLPIKGWGAHAEGM